MTFTCDELKGLEHPYEVLGNGDALAENREELNKLSNDEKLVLASRLVLECPVNELKDFSHAIEAARMPQDDSDTFHSFLFQAYQVKKRIISLLDPRNKNPHSMILEKEFDGELFNNFNKLAIDVLNNNEVAIALRLAETTPAQDRSRVSQNINNIFPQSLFAAKVGHAFAVRRDIERLLLGDRPDQFFSSREFKIDSCIEFASLFNVINDKESSIAGKLALRTPAENRTDVVMKIKGFCAEDSELAIKVQSALALRRDIERNLLGDNPEQFFNSRDFSVDLCLEFAILFPELLKGHEQAIGEKLAKLDAKVRSDISRKLEMINGAAHEQSSPFRIIASAMVPKEEPCLTKPTPVVLPSTEEIVPKQESPTSLRNRNVLFKEQTEEHKKKNSQMEPIVSDSEEEEEEKQNCWTSFCGLFGK
ncbi:TPA: lpg0008 family Dot/Icm T4SS effector [Legionella pneumophila]